MYKQGQTLKITATEHNVYVKEGASFTVSVVEDVRADWDHEVRVQFSAEDAVTLNNRGRDQLSFAFKQTLPTFYPTWTIEIVDAEPKTLPAQPEVTTGTVALSREDWNVLQSTYAPMMSERTYDEYLHNFFDSGLVYDQPRPAYTVRLPDVGWERTGLFETNVVAEVKIEGGQKLCVTITDDSRRKDYVIDESLIVDKNNQILEYLDPDRIRLIGYDGTERHIAASA